LVDGLEKTKEFRRKIRRVKLLSLFDFRREKRARRLYDEARELIDSYGYEEALEIGRKLRKLNYSGAFEIEGLAYSHLDRNEDAVRVLREGLTLAPGVFQNWLLLGSCLSNLRRYDEAMLAYERAEACEEADASLVDLNRAIVSARREDREGTLRYLDRITGYESSGMRYRTLDLRVDALHGLGRVSEAEDLGQSRSTSGATRRRPKESGRRARSR
jgi:tetratricopeptide (TPR) repeat protein